jgi:hypothetical protein
MPIAKKGSGGLLSAGRSAVASLQRLAGGAEPPDPERVFISYSWKDRGFVTELCENLHLLFLPLWFDRWELDLPDEVADSVVAAKLRSGLMRCSAAVFLLNDFSAASKWVAFEIATALEIKSQRPDYRVVGLVTEEPASRVPPGILGDAPILDFTSGYKTALVKLKQILAREPDDVSGYGVEAVMRTASRTLRGDVSLGAHMRSLGLPAARAAQIETFRDVLARQERPPRVRDVFGLLDALDATRHFDVVMSGNVPRVHGRPGAGDGVVVSFLPTIDYAAQRMSDLENRVQLLFLSLWPSRELPGAANLTTLMAQFSPDGSCFVWLMFAGGMHRYTMGSAQDGSVLLTEKREMGNRAYAFRWPNVNPDGKLLYQRQGLANRLGLGQVQVGQQFAEPAGLGIENASTYTLWRMADSLEKQAPDPMWTEPEGWAAELWRSVVADGWQQPEVTQTDALLGHLKMGGLLLFEVSPRSSITPVLAEQMTQAVECAGGSVHRQEIGWSGEWVQHICASPRWDEMIRRCTEPADG